MKRAGWWFIIAVLAMAHAGAGRLLGQVRLAIDGDSPGRIFEGIGALSAGASSRLLIDYPEPVRSDILDILFKPGYAASLQHLKVEIGGDVNSTDGSEPAWARTREEFTEPRKKQFERGYEWWLMGEAKKRNPSIFLDILQWGAPPWIGSLTPGAGKPPAPRFFSQDNADFIAGFIEGAGKYHGLAIDYCGIWNETPYDTAWITALRRTLDRRNLAGVKIVAADQTPGVASSWTIANEILADGELARAVHAIGVHYSSSTGWKYALKEPYASTAEAKRTSKPLWASEDGPWRGDWEGARALAKIFNRSYVVGRMTKTVIWSLITSYLDNLPIPGSGPMKANAPWSGHYEIQPALWAIAHTTQFTKPGWRYVDASCVLFPGGGSSVALRSPDGSDWSLIAETMDSKAAETLAVRISGALKNKTLNVWRTTENSQFQRLAPITPAGGSFSLILDTGAIYSLTSTPWGMKGLPAHIVPPASDIPLPYSEDFEGTAIGRAPKYFSDLNGAFEVVKSPDGGKCLHQVIRERGIEWPLAEQPEPRTVIGARLWSNYEVSSDIRLEGGWAGICARFDRPWRSGYWLKLSSEGTWTVTARNDTLGRGTVKDFDPSRSHRLSLSCRAITVTASIDGEPLDTTFAGVYKHGFAGLGTGWNEAFFDNFTVRPVKGPVLKNLAEGKRATSSSSWSGEFDAKFAVDGNAESRWNAAEGRLAGEWLEIDFGQTTGFNMISVRQFESRIAKYAIRVFEDGLWRDVIQGDTEGETEWADFFGYTKASKVRLSILSTQGNDPVAGTPSVYELEVYDTLF